MRKLRTQAEIVKGSRYSLGYGAVDDTTRRRRIISKPSPEIAILDPIKRDRASATTRDDRRNMTILAWMIRRHLDNVSRFTPHFRISGDTTEIANLNSVVKRLLYWHGTRRNFDVLGRHGRDEWMRMFEACKVIEGDCGGLKAAGGKLQGIEGERIRKPSEIGQVPKNVTDDGLTFRKDGTRSGFCLCKRVGNTGMEFERLVPESEMVFDAYWPERFDSNRGVSPLLTALNEGADVRETWEWHLTKIKASGIFGFAFTRAESDEIFATQGEPNTEPPASKTAAYTDQVSKAIKSRGLVNLDLDPGDDVKAIESEHPNPNIIPFTREIIRSVLLALDIPFTFYDSLTASFSARIADRNEYEESCEWKRDKNVNVLDEIYNGWLFEMWSDADLFGFGKALKAAKMSVEEVGTYLRWVPAGRPWLDRSSEMSGHILALAAGVTSTPRIAASYGEDAYEIAAEQAEYLSKAGQPLLYAQGGQIAVQAIMAGMGQKPAQEPINSETTKE